MTGTVICIDTVRIDVARCEWASAKNTKYCRWEDQQVKDRVYFIRIFYCPGEPKQEHIGKITCIVTSPKDALNVIYQSNIHAHLFL